MANFNKKIDLVELVAERMADAEGKKVSKKRAEEIVETVLASMKDLIIDEEHDGLDIYGFVRFVVSTVKEKETRNPRTGSSQITPEHRQVRAKFSSVLKEAVR